MSIAEKLQTIAKNEQAVYAAGKSNGHNEGKENFITNYLARTLTEIDIPEGVTVIREHAFRGQNKVVRLNIPEGVTEIQQEAFRNIESLKFLTLPSTLETIGTAVFNCDYVLGYYQDLVLPPNLKTIGNLAFGYCSIQNNLIIPASVETIGAQAFIGAPRSTVTFKGTPKSIAANAFIKSGTEWITDIYVPWSEDEVANAPWGAVAANIHYNYAEVE